MCDTENEVCDMENKVCEMENEICDMENEVVVWSMAYIMTIATPCQAV